MKNIADIQVGYQARGRIQEKEDGVYHLIQGRDFDERLRLQPGKLASFIPERKPTPYAVRKGDILFQARGMDNFAYHLEEELPNTIAAGSRVFLCPRGRGRLRLSSNANLITNLIANSQTST